jgi:hypothetical protein
MGSIEHVHGNDDDDDDNDEHGGWNLSIWSGMPHAYPDASRERTHGAMSGSCHPSHATEKCACTPGPLARICDFTVHVCIIWENNG